MKYIYIGKKYVRNEFRKRLDINHSLKAWLETIILAEKPYLADNLVLEDPDKETEILLKLCRFFSAVLKDEHPEPISTSEWSLEFEGKHHGLIGTYLNFIRNIYNKKV